MSVAPMTSAIAKIRREIPREILELAFNPEKHQQTLDERIVEEVVRKGVLIDINQVAGKLTRIALFDEWREQTEIPGLAGGVATTLGSDIYRIPPEGREYRNIGSTIKLIYGNYYSGYDQNAAFLSDAGNSITALGRVALGSRTMSNQNNVPVPYYLGNNMVKVTPRILSVNLLLECLLEYDAEFTNLPHTAVISLTNLIVNATKTYIFNRLWISIDANEMRNGAPIGSVKELIGDYRQEKDAYQELLMKFRGNCVMDPDLARKMAALAF